MLEPMRHTLRMALRSLARSPAFVVVAVLTLGLGIGANTALFSVVNTVVLRPLPFPDGDRLVLIWNQLANVPKAAVSGPDFVDYAEQTEDVFEDMVGTFATTTNLTGDGDAESVTLSWVSPSFFTMFGAAPILGRDFTDADVQTFDMAQFSDPDTPPPALPVILSHGLWQQRYGAETAILGRTIHANGQVMTVVGVAPEGFRLYMPPDAALPTDVDIWTVWPVDLRTMPRVPSGIITVMGKLRPGVTLAQAQNRMDGVAARLREAYQSHALAELRAAIHPMHEEAVGHVRPTVLVLFGAVGFVLLIACANVANLLLVRAASREKEVAIRAALGGGRRRMVTQLLLESLLLAGGGAVLGLGLAYVGIDLLLSIQASDLPRVEHVGIDPAALGFTLLASLAAVGLFGLVPAWQATRTDLSSALKERGGTANRSRHRLQHGLIVLEVAVSVVLLVGAGLMLRSLARLTSVQPGFDAANVLTFHLSLPVWAYRGGDSRAQFFRELDRRLDQLPGVVAAGGVNPLPLSSTGQFGSGPYARSIGDAAAWEQNEADYRAVMPGFFEAVSVPLLAGRTFDERDNLPDARPVAIIDRVMAERAFAGEDPVGQQLVVGKADSTLTGGTATVVDIVGIVDHIRFIDLSREGRETIFVPQSFTNGYQMGYTVKTVGDPVLLAPQVRAIAREVGSDVPVMDITPLHNYVRQALAPTRFAMTLLAVFAGVALVLASVGLYGVISYAMRQRRRELSLRLALGAERDHVIKLLLGMGLRLGVAGLVLGLAGAVLLSEAMGALLFGVAGTDPLTYGTIAGLLLAVTLAASWVPALRASRANPVEVLRDE
jgi:putative ABC transport system permease protein